MAAKNEDKSLMTEAIDATASTSLTLIELQRQVTPQYATDWREIGLELGLTDAKLRAIRIDNPHSVRDCCNTMFSEWLKVDATASWEKLFAAIKSPAVSGGPVRGTSSHSSQGSSTQQAITPPIHSQGDDQLPEEQTETETLLRFKARSISTFTGKYAKIVDQIKQIIDKQEIDIESLILNLCACDTEKRTIFSTDEAFVKVKNTVQLFLEIMKYCSLYDYELLLAFVESVDCDEAMKLLDDFAEKLKNSILQTLDLLPELKDPKILPGTHKLIIKYTGGKCTLENTKFIRNVLYECFNLKRVSITFIGAEEGCVAFIFQISSAVKSYLLQYKVTTEDFAVLAKHNITHVVIDDQVLKVSVQDQKDEVFMWSKQDTNSTILPPHEVDLYKPKAVANFSKHMTIESALTRTTSQIKRILELKKFEDLRRAYIERIKESNLPGTLVVKIQKTNSLDEMLNELSQSPYWNCFDTKLLQALVSASGSAEAKEWLESFKEIFYAEKITKFIPYVSRKPFRESIDLKEKFDKDPKDLTVSELLQHKLKLVKALDIDEDEPVLSCIKTGCVELTWQIPQELVYQAYTSMKRKHDELSSLAVKSLVFEEADKYAGLPILWRGQEVVEVGPIEPLPEHVRQEPYSLQQGFQWITLNSSNTEEVVKFRSIHGEARRDTVMFGNILVRMPDLHVDTTNYYLYRFSHPHTRSEWQFGIRTTDGKLVGVVLAPPAVCLSIGGVSVMCVVPDIFVHKKYRNKRLWHILFKELQRRANLNKISQFILSITTGLLKPITTKTVRRYHFTLPTMHRLPNSPKTPGWRKMTSEDVPSALALVNKYSSQFEIKRVFTSEEEFSHLFLCPAVPNYVFTYVVENESKVTDFVSYYIFETIRDDINEKFAGISAVVSTQSQFQDLIRDAFVCAIEGGAQEVLISQFIEDDVLSSLAAYAQLSSHHQLSLHYLYNYKYHSLCERDCFLLF